MITLRPSCGLVSRQSGCAAAACVARACCESSCARSWLDELGAQGFAPELRGCTLGLCERIASLAASWRWLLAPVALVLEGCRCNKAMPQLDSLPSHAAHAAPHHNGRCARADGLEGEGPIDSLRRRAALTEPELFGRASPARGRDAASAVRGVRLLRVELRRLVVTVEARFGTTWDAAALLGAGRRFAALSRSGVSGAPTEWILCRNAQGPARRSPATRSYARGQPRTLPRLRRGFSRATRGSGASEAVSKPLGIQRVPCGQRT